MKTSQNKSHFLSSLDTGTKFLIRAWIVENSISQKFLVVTIERKLNFLEHVTNLCDKISRKIQALAGIFPYTEVLKLSFMAQKLFTLGPKI